MSATPDVLVFACLFIVLTVPQGTSLKGVPQRKLLHTPFLRHDEGARPTYL